jgi:hypothetical protein
MIFPLFSIDQGKITSIKGEMSYLYKIIHLDLSQLSIADLESFYFDLHQELKTLKE